MRDWYHAFLVCALLLWIVSTPRDRNALRIILIASLASEVIVDTITHQIHGAWKLVIPGAVEVITILAMVKWSRNVTGFLQVVLLVIAWLSHVLCYFDVLLKTDLVYSRYEVILQAVAVGQLAACYDTMRFNFGIIRSGFSAFFTDNLCAVPHASVRPDVSGYEGSENLQAIKTK